MVLSRLATLLEQPEPLALVERPEPVPGAGEILVRVSACGVCHTELDEIEGRTPPPHLPVIPGHQVVGTVAVCGPGAARFAPGARVGIGWIHSACGACERCRRGEENLCERFVATGRDVDGGYAELMRVPETFAVPIPPGLSDLAAAPLLCAGAIGWRSLRLTGLGDGGRLGLTGFGASGHLVLKMARHVQPATRVYVFSRNAAEREFALELGAVWAGGIGERAPEPLDAIIDTTPAWRPVVEALADLAPGGRLVINAIRKEPADKDALLALDWADHLWREKEIKSVANVTRADIAATLELAAAASLAPEVEEHPLEAANEALRLLRRGGTRGARVLRIS
jgi:propanol-preferring alcohol dehydrogenase